MLEVLYLIGIIHVPKCKCCLCAKNKVGKILAERLQSISPDQRGTETLLKTSDKELKHDMITGKSDTPYECALVATNSLKMLII